MPEDYDAYDFSGTDYWEDPGWWDSYSGLGDLSSIDWGSYDTTGGEFNQYPDYITDWNALTDQDWADWNAWLASPEANNYLSGGTTNEVETRGENSGWDTSNPSWLTSLLQGGRTLLGGLGNTARENPMVTGQILAGLGNLYGQYRGSQPVKDLPDYQGMRTPSQLYNDPYVQGMLGQVNRQTSAAAAARGMNTSGRTLQEIADNSYTRALLPLMQMEQGQNQFQNQYQYNQALAKAGAQAGFWNTAGQTAGNVGQAWSLQNMMNQEQQQNAASDAQFQAALQSFLDSMKPRQSPTEPPVG